MSFCRYVAGGKVVKWSKGSSKAAVYYLFISHQIRQLQWKAQIARTQVKVHAFVFQVIYWYIFSIKTKNQLRSKIVKISAN